MRVWCVCGACSNTGKELIVGTFIFLEAMVMLAYKGFLTPKHAQRRKSWIMSFHQWLNEGHINILQYLSIIRSFVKDVIVKKFVSWKMTRWGCSMWKIFLMWKIENLKWRVTHTKSVKYYFISTEPRTKQLSSGVSNTTWCCWCEMKNRGSVGSLYCTYHTIEKKHTIEP